MTNWNDGYDKARNVKGRVNVFDVTLVLDAGNVYGDGDVLAITAAVANFFLEAGGKAYINGIQVLDEDNQGVAFDLLLMDANTDIGTLNNAAAITDAEARSILGWVDVNAADYTTWLTNIFKTATIKAGDTGMFVPGWIKAAAGSTSLYIGAISRGAGTYTANGLKLKIAVEYP
jgi:hypothetical protein